MATVGAGLIILSNLFFQIANSIDAWQYDWYRTITSFLNVLHLVAWVLIGQFFLNLYKKTK
jgi:hypothetical protein